jgi:hypothetical protein
MSWEILELFRSPSARFSEFGIQLARLSEYNTGATKKIISGVSTTRGIYNVVWRQVLREPTGRARTRTVTLLVQQIRNLEVRIESDCERTKMRRQGKQRR